MIEILFYRELDFSLKSMVGGKEGPVADTMELPKRTAKRKGTEKG